MAVTNPGPARGGAAFESLGLPLFGRRVPLSLVVAMLRGGTGLLRGWTGLQPLAAPWQRAFATRSASHVKHSEKKTKLPVPMRLRRPAAATSPSPRK